MYDVTDNRGVPVSRGLPMIVRVSAIIGIIAIFAIGAFTINQAGYGHHWPWNKTLRIDLNSK